MKKEKIPKKTTKETKRTITEENSENKTLGDYLLEKEHRMNKSAREILAQHEEKQGKKKN